MNIVFYVARVLTTLLPLAYNQSVLRRAQATDDLHACLLIAKANTGPSEARGSNVKRLRLFTLAWRLLQVAGFECEGLSVKTLYRYLHARYT